MPPARRVDWDDVARRFWCKVDVQFQADGTSPDFSRCWPWKSGAVSGKRNLYGRISIHNRLHKSHRIAFRLHYGRKIPDHLDGGHTCDYPPCNNPTHIKPCTHRANVQAWWFQFGRFKTKHQPQPRPATFLPLTETEKISA